MSDKTFTIVMIGMGILFIVCLCAFVWSLSQVATQVEQKGLKSIATELWCGKEGCK